MNADELALFPAQTVSVCSVTLTRRMLNGLDLSLMSILSVIQTAEDQTRVLS